jgi:hypothetical protein
MHRHTRGSSRVCAWDATETTIADGAGGAVGDKITG